MVGIWYLLIYFTKRCDNVSLSIYSGCARSLTFKRGTIKLLVVCSIEWMTAVLFIALLTWRGAISFGNTNFNLLLIATFFSPAAAMAIIKIETKVLFFLDKRTQRLNWIPESQKKIIRDSCRKRFGSTNQDAIIIPLWIFILTVAFAVDRKEIGQQLNFDGKIDLWAATYLAILYYGFISSHSFMLFFRIGSIFKVISICVSRRSHVFFNTAIAPALHRAAREMFIAYSAGLFFIPFLAYPGTSPWLVGNLGRNAIVASYGATFAFLYLLLFLLIDDISKKESEKRCLYLERQSSKFENVGTERANIQNLIILVKIVLYRDRYKVFEKVVIAQLTSIVLLPVAIGSATEFIAEMFP